MDPHAASPRLAELANRYGVATAYWDWHGGEAPVSAQTIVAILAALDVDAGDEAAVERSLAHAEDRQWQRTLPATVVSRQGWTPWVAVHVTHGDPVTVDIELEDGTVRSAHQVDNWVEPRWVEGRLIGRATFELPADLPLGWHTLRARVDGVEHLDDETRTATLIVAPQRLEPPAAGRLWGAAAQLYQVRSSRSWGIGDLRDLRDVSRWVCQLGGDFVLVNPLHAQQPVPPIEPSPYLPTSRRFGDPIYLVPQDIPEYTRLDPAGRAAVEALAEQAAGANLTDRIDRDAVWTAKRPVLRTIYDAGREASRQAAFDAYRAEQGQALVDFATWCAIALVHTPHWRSWPAELHRPDSAEVAAFRAEHAVEVDFLCWLQWQVEDQMEATQQAARAAGMALGIITDLAVGVHSEGAESWAQAHLLAQGATVGAPPDQFNQLGQNWCQPPWRPDRLAEVGYAPYRDLLRAVLRHAGGVRIDHIIGLFRLWWVPQGRSADQGTYVRYDHEALLGILALEAHRAGAVVIGEDLGVVEPTARKALAERGIHGTSIMWFEWEGGAPLDPERYRDLCLTAVTTHDLPPTAGYVNLEHVRIREMLGLLTRSAEEERAVEAGTVEAFRALAAERGLLAPGADEEEVVVALHRLIALSPSRLLLAGVADLAGDHRAINQPGTSREYPNWQLPLTGPDGRVMLLEDLMAAPRAVRIAAALTSPLDPPN